MISINCIIADDEPLARNILETYISNHPMLTLTASCTNAFEVQAEISKQTCDLLFLDINMPQVSGISLLKSLSNPPTVIITTAYPEYAVEGFELNVADYLLKPFSFERFMKAVNKALMFSKKETTSDLQNQYNQCIFFKVDKKLQKVQLGDILYLESTGDYVKVFSKKECLVINDTLKNLQEQLSEQWFMRVHKSFIISFEHVHFVEGNFIRIENRDIPIGATYKEEFMLKLQEKNRRKIK